MPKKNDDITIINESEFCKVYYMPNDPIQREYQLVGITIRPGGAKILHLDYLGDEIEVYEGQASDTRDELKYMEGKYNNPDADDD